MYCNCIQLIVIIILPIIIIITCIVILTIVKGVLTDVEEQNLLPNTYSSDTIFWVVEIWNKNIVINVNALVQQNIKLEVS